jgi:hypothetical protein
MTAFRRRHRLASALLVAAIVPLLAGCSLGPFANLSPTSSPSPTKTFDTRTGAPSPGAPDAESGPTGSPTNADGSIDVCNTISVATVAKVTGLKLTTAQGGDPDTFPGSGYTTYGCIFYGSDPVNLSVVISVEAGDVNEAFQDNSDGIKPTFGWGPIQGVGDRAEGDGAHVLDVLWGSRYVIQIVDNTPDSDVGVKNMATLATDVHQKLGE